jgi:hypothetical protein
MTRSIAILSLIGYVSITQSSSNGIVTVSVPVVVARAGEQSEFNLGVEINEGYHVQSSKVKDELIPTSVEFNSIPGFTFNKIIFPSAKKFKLEGADDTLDVYDGKFSIKIVFTTDSKIKKDPHQLNGKLKYQACDSVRCLFPKSVDFSIRVEIQ